VAYLRDDEIAANQPDVEAGVGVSAAGSRASPRCLGGRRNQGEVRQSKASEHVPDDRAQLRLRLRGRGARLQLRTYGVPVSPGSPKATLSIDPSTNGCCAKVTDPTPR